MHRSNRYLISRSSLSITPNIWDIIVITVIFGTLASLAWAAMQMTAPYQIGEPIEITLDPRILPQYAISTVVRMFIALFFSLLFTFIIAPLAAKNHQAGKLVLPFIDIMQSIPVLGILSIAVIVLIPLFPNSLLGPECAAILAIFTSQVWNMALSLYQSLRTVPNDLQEAASIYKLSSWQRFWRVEIPHATPLLIWNTMVSMSAGWFFVVLSEAISIADQNITLPGIGSYIHKAILQKNLPAMGYAILSMFIIILLCDQFLFRPLLAWADKFKAEIDEDEVFYQSWFFDVLAKTRLLKKTENVLSIILDIFINGLPSTKHTKYKKSILLFSQKLSHKFSTISTIIWNIFLAISILWAINIIWNLIKINVHAQEIYYVMYLGLITAIKVIILIILASIIWIPIGVWIGLNSTATQICQPLIQFCAAFPANFFYPLVVIFILKYNLNSHIWTMPLMILGTQWYILFNVIGGAASIPKELRLATKNLGVTGWLWWKRLILPGIFPSYITGAMAAAGGCWNASIVAEFVQWGDHIITSIGLGYYIEEYTRKGDFSRIALGIAVMCFYVMIFNRLLWQRLYNTAKNRFSLD